MVVNKNEVNTFCVSDVKSNQIKTLINIKRKIIKYLFN